MASTPLFTRDELAAAFMLLMPAAEAAKLATEWFGQFADEIDEQGRFVYPDTWGDPKPIEPRASVEPPAEWDLPEAVVADERTFQGWTDGDARAWFMRLGDLHLALVATVNEDLYERMRRARYMSNKVAARNRQQIVRAVRAYRIARGWPPAV